MLKGVVATMQIPKLTPHSLSGDHDSDKLRTMALNRSKFEPQMIEARLHDGTLMMYSPCRSLHYSIPTTI